MVIDTKDTAEDVKLFKIIGLYRCLGPVECGGLSEHMHRVTMTLVWLSIGYFTVQFAWLPSTLHDIQSTMLTLTVIAYCLSCSFKAYKLLRHAPRHWAVLDSCRFAFTGCSFRQPVIMRQCRDTVSWILRPFVLTTVGGFITWLLIPLFWTNPVSVAHMDGTVGRYRPTVFSMWFPLPESIHNSLPGWTVLYVCESFSFFISCCGLILFDSYVITMCYVLSAHFRTISAGYETLGRHLQTSPSDSHCGMCNHRDNHIIGVLQNMKRKSMQLNHYDDLIDHIQDNQKLMKTYDEFVNIIQPSVIIHVLLCSFSMITFMFLSCLAIVSDQPTINAEFFKMIFTFITFTVQLFMYCYGCNLIETAKSSLNFGLFCCNWMEMDLRFQKTILLAMTMNSAHKKSFKITGIYVINLEFVTRVMKASFSAIPVLLHLQTS